MPKIAFVGPSYSARSLMADAQRTLNAYLEFDNASPRAPQALYGTPGSVLEFTLSDAPMRAMVQMGDHLYAVAGRTVFRIVLDGAGVWTATSLGTIGTNEGTLGVACNGAQVFLCDRLGGWLIEAATATLTAILDADYPVGVTQATQMDGYFIATGDGSGRFYINHTPRNGAEWDGTDFASAEGAPDNTVTCISNHRELWLFGNASAEVWVNSGDPDFPFSRSGNAFIEVGTAAAASLRALDNTLYWLGASAEGSGIVYRAAGYSPQRISTFAIEREIQSYGVISDAIAMTYEQDGHSFYVLTFPTAGKTWVFDASAPSTDMAWHQRAWRTPGTNELQRWRANCHVHFRGKHLVGDWENGNVYSLDLDTYTDNGVAILRQRVTQCLDSPEGFRNFYSRLQVDMEAGVGLATGQGSAPLLMMEFSDDGGRSWSEIQTVSIGAGGEYGARALFRRLGAGRNRVWRISLSDPVKFAVFGAYVGVTGGEA